MGCSASQSTKVTSSNNNNATTGPQKKESQNSSGRHSTGSLGRPELRKRGSSGSGRFSNQERVDSVQEEHETHESEKGVEEDEDDDEVFSTSENNSQAQNGLEENRLSHDVNGELEAKPLKNVPLSGPLYSGNRQFSRSQTDFFKMLDEKIATGQSLSSQESVR